MAVLTVRNVRSYSSEIPVIFDLSQKVTLIYGQNGAGKSTISGYFSGYEPDNYRDCIFDSDEDLRQLAFNQEYIERKFHKEDVQPGIFTLSEHNQELQNKINSNQVRLK